MNSAFGGIMYVTNWEYIAPCEIVYKWANYLSGVRGFKGEYCVPVWLTKILENYEVYKKKK